MTSSSAPRDIPEALPVDGSAGAPPGLDLPGSLPEGVAQVRTTPVFDETSVPAGLLAAHQLATGVWAQVVVQQGSLDFVFEDAPDRPIHLSAGGSLVVPPQQPHHVVVNGPVRFALELYR